MKKLKTSILLALSFFIASSGFSQSIIGNWKPAFFAMDTLMHADVNSDSIFFSPTLKDSLKNEKDPAASQYMMSLFFQLLMKTMKETEEEYLAGGIYKEKNLRTKGTINGTYTYNAKTAQLIKQYASKERRTYTVSWKERDLVLSTIVTNPGGKKVTLTVVYKKRN